MTEEKNDDKLELSEHAISALNEFLSEQQEQQIKFEQLKAKSLSCIQNYLESNSQDSKQDNKDDDNNTEINIDFFKEDWQLSQFWYDEVTSNFLAQEVLTNTNPDSRIACISTPTAFVKLKSIKPTPKQTICLFEFDTRFDVYGTDFYTYDYKNPTNFRNSQELRNSFDFILVDPPFLSEDCCTKSMITVRWLEKRGNCKILLCTGAVMRDLIYRLIKAKMSTFIPQHKGGLANDFRCYSNYESQNIKWVKDE
ncbi:13690_t:CDS:2 [Funneliformis mosseae]|uniref:Protein-lysine N-methyltransferase EFM5 n=1 Tax=Funneliformis mosseae TaxID=27381 RepID=A0A9N9CPS7_FUNMO|nr:13690_t:CDS:2 [Funneliformis mosseae]